MGYFARQMPFIGNFVLLVVTKSREGRAPIARASNRSCQRTLFRRPENLLKRFGLVCGEEIVTFHVGTLRFAHTMLAVFIIIFWMVLNAVPFCIFVFPYLTLIFKRA